MPRRNLCHAIHIGTVQSLRREPPYIYHYDFFDRQHLPQSANWHKSLEFLLCTVGSGTVLCNGRVLPFEPGDLIVINSNYAHCVSTASKIEYHCLIAKSDFLSQIGFSPETVYFREQIRDPEISDEYLSAVRAFQTDDSCRLALTTAALCGFMVALDRKYRIREEQNDDTGIRKKIQSAVQYIQARYTTPLSVEEIAGAVGLSPSHYSREFRRYTGRTTVEYVNILRCQLATTYLSDGYSVSDTAQLCGFENRSYFSKVYKTYCSRSPSEVFQQKPEGSDRCKIPPQRSGVHKFK